VPLHTSWSLQLTVALDEDTEEEAEEPPTNAHCKSHLPAIKFFKSHTGYIEWKWGRRAPSLEDNEDTEEVEGMFL
jgi:hypothetical protein